MFKSRITAVAVGASVLALVATSGAVAAGQIGSSDIKDDSVRSVDIKNDTVRSKDIHDYTIKKRDLRKNVWDVLAKDDAGTGTQGPAGPAGPAGKDGATGPAGPAGADGKDGVSNIQAGSSYSSTWAGDNGAAVHTAREECPAGQYALGGGFSTWGGDKDLGGDNKSIQITVSAPYFEGDYTPISDTNSNFRPTEWVVKGYNNGSTDQIVRAWVVCADAN